MSRSRVKYQAQTPILLEEKGNELPLITELKRIMSLKNKKIELKLISKRHYPSIMYTVSASCDNIITFGHGSCLEEAKTKSAIAFWVLMNTNNINNMEIPSTSFTSNSIDEDPQETVYCNKSNSIIPSSIYDLSVKPSVVEKNVFQDSNRKKSVTTQLASCSLNDKYLRKESSITSIFNPINELQELCLSHHWMLPTYNLINDGPTHTSTLTVACILSIYTYFGVGNTEQTAKKQAATNMLNKIKNISQNEMNNIPNNIYEYGLAKDSGISFLFDKNVNNIGKEKCYTNDSIRLLEMYFKTSLDHDRYKQSNSLNIPKMKAVDVLDKVTKQKGVSTKYVIFPKNSSGIKVLIQILTIPIFVCMNYGETKIEAQEKTAHSALTYLKYQIDNEII